MEAIEGPEGQTLYVCLADGKRGSKGPFAVVYTDEEGTNRWGFRCEFCKSLDNAVDPMGRIQCNECSNRTKAEEWDAAHE